jgi:hypothetical protein
MASRVSLIQSRSIYVGTSNSVAPSDGNLIVTGNVGIGTTSPTTTLDVRTDAGVLIKGASSDIDGRIALVPASGGRQYGLRNYGSSFGIKDESADVIRMYFHYDGNTGIGTTAPASLLHVAGGNIMISNTVAAAAPVGGIVFKQTNSTGFDIAQIQGIAGATVVEGIITMSTKDSGGTMNERLRITSAGNVGIGTTSPASLLTIFGAGNTLRLDSSSGADKEILMRSVGTGTGTLKTDGNLRLWSEDSGRSIIFKTFGGESSIASTGNVLIGTTTDSGEKLVVNGTIGVPFSSTIRVAGGGFTRNDIFQTGYNNVSDLKDFLILEAPGSSNGKIVLGTGAYANVGIRNNTPQSALDILAQGNTAGGTMMLSGSKTNNAVKYGVITTAQYASDTESEGVGLIGGTNTSTENIVNIGGGVDELNTATSIRFFAAANTTTRGSANERMRVNAANDAGNLYIGTTSTNDFGRLIVNGFSGAWLPYIADTSLSYNQYGIVVGSANTGNTNIGGGLTLVNNNASVGAYGPVVSWSSMTAGGAYNSTYAFITGIYGGQGGDTNWAIGDLIFGTAQSYGAAERMRIRYNGNVLIGSTTDAGYKLDVNGSLRATTGVFTIEAGTPLQVYQTNATNQTTAIIRQTTAGGNGNQDIGLLVDIQGAGDTDRIANFRYYDGSTYTSRMAIMRGGNVGIGTTSPLGPLEVYRSATGGLGGHIIVNNNGTAVGNETALMFGDGGLTGIRAAISCTTEDAPYKGELRFKSGVNSYSLLSTNMVIKGNGNVLIGTTTDAGYKLAVNGKAVFGTSQSLEIGNAAANPVDSGISYGIFHQSGVGLGIVSGAGGTTQGIDFWSNDGTNYFQSMRISGGNGNVGVGTTTPAVRFQVAGQTSFYNGVTSTGAIDGGVFEQRTVGFNLGPSESIDISTIGLTSNTTWKAILSAEYANNLEGGGLTSSPLEIELDSDNPTVLVGSTNITLSRNASTGKLQVTNNNASYRVTFVGSIKIWNYPQSAKPTISKVMLKNVGIGITNPTVKLDVDGPGRFVSDAFARVFYLKQNANNSGNIIQFQDQSGNNTWELVGRNNQFYFYNAALTNFPIYIHPATSNVSMSSSTDIGDKLFVNGSIAAVGGITIRESGSGILSLVRQNSGYTASTYYYENASLYWNVGMTAGSYSWRVNDPNYGVNNKLVVSQGFDWGVGIGTDSPTRRLHIVGTTRHERVYAYANNVFQFANDISQNELWLHLGTQAAFTTDKIYYRVNTNTSEEEGEIIVKNTCATANIEWFRNSYNVMVTAVKARMQGGCGACEIFIKVRYGSNYGGANTTVQWQVHNGTDAGFTTVNAVATPGTGTSEANIASTDGYMVSTSNNQSVGGSLGVGTTTPNQRLSVEGGGIQLNANNAAANYYLFLNKKNGQDGGILFNRDNGNDWQLTNVTNNGNLLFYSYGTATEAITFTKATGNVLIGTITDIGTKLNVNGSSYISGAASFGSTIDVNGNVTLTQDTNDLIFQQTNSSSHGIVWKNTSYAKDSASIRPTGNGAWATQGIGFYTGSFGNSTSAPLLRFNIQAGGDSIFYNNVGIGTTSPGSKLEVVSSTTQIADFSSPLVDGLVNIRIFNSAQTTSSGTAPAAIELVGKRGSSTHGRHAWIGAEGVDGTTWRTQIKFKVRPENSPYEWSTLPTQMVIDGNGNVGIGTTSPDAKLDVQRDARTGSHATSQSLYVTGTMGGGTTGGQAGNIEFRHSNGSQGIGFGYQTIYQTGDNTNEVLNILSRGTGALTLNAYAYSSGNVLIGTTTDSGYKLRVNGSSYFDAPILCYTGNGYITALTNDGTGSLDGFGYSFLINNTGHEIGRITGRYTDSASGGSGGMSFFTRSAGTLGKRMELTAGGALNIYNTSPVSTAGTNFIAYAYDSDSFFKLGNNTSNSLDIQLTRSDTNTMFAVDGHSGASYFFGNMGIGQSAPSYKLDVSGTIRATGDVIAYSDARVKENVQTIDGALDKVLDMRGVSYNKIGEHEKKVGVIAQEILKVLPEVVSQDETGTYSVAYGNITAVLIEAVKELASRVELLEEKLKQQ